jgi:hypothetical protein
MQSALQCKPNAFAWVSAMSMPMSKMHSTMKEILNVPTMRDGTSTPIQGLNALKQP